MEGGERENREPRHEPGDLGAVSQGQQSRAAASIQDRWRGYRQRRQEEARNTETSEGQSEGEAGAKAGVTVTETGAEEEQRCSPTQALCCCPQQKVKH